MMEERISPETAARWVRESATEPMTFNKVAGSLQLVTMEFTRVHRDWLLAEDAKEKEVFRAHELEKKLDEATKYGTPEETVACTLETVRTGMLAVFPNPHHWSRARVEEYLDGPAHKDVVEALAKRAEARHG